MHCGKEKPCDGLMMAMAEGAITFAEDVKLPGFTDGMCVMFIKGQVTVRENGDTKINSHILNGCPFCLRPFVSFIDNYAPPLVNESYKPKSNLILI